MDSTERGEESEVTPCIWLICYNPLMSFSREQYKAHLKSQYWREFKRDYLKPYCERCGSRYRIDGHHKTYAHFGNEKQYPQDVMSLCRKCHDAIHFNAFGVRRKNWRQYNGGGTANTSAYMVIVLLILLALSWIIWQLLVK